MFFKRAFQLVLAAALIMLISCSDNESVLPLEIEKSNVVKIKAFADVRNIGNASDLRIMIDIVSPASVDEVRMFIAKSSTYSGLSADDIQMLEPESYHPIKPESNSLEIIPDPLLRDVEGEEITEGPDYVLGFAVIIAGELQLDRNYRSFQLDKEHYLAGTYIGTWNDNLYSDFPVSAQLSYKDGVLSGPFYYTGAFISCCQGKNDGYIRVTLSNSTITYFVYHQTLANFNGGQCDGEYTGQGEVVNYRTLEIEFEGTDCEGLHFDGFLQLTK